SCFCVEPLRGSVIPLSWCEAGARQKIPMPQSTDRVEQFMETKIDEIADGICRLSTFVPDIAPPAGFTFNQFLVLADEPLMLHTGLRKMFPLNRDAVSRIMAPDRLCWITFGHFESDEWGAMNEWLAVAPQATPAHGHTGCMVSLNDFVERAPRVLGDG